MAETKSIKTYLRIWRKKRGVKKNSTTNGGEFYTVPIKDRRRLLIIFLRWMRMLGFTEERFRKTTFQDELISICFGDAPAFDEKRRKMGHAALREQLEDVLDVEGIFEGKRSKNKPLKAAPVQAPVQQPEQPIERVGRPVNTDLYKDVAKNETQMDEEFLALLEQADKDE